MISIIYKQTRWTTTHTYDGGTNYVEDLRLISPNLLTLALSRSSEFSATTEFDLGLTWACLGGV
jgi:hypothetical protein